MTCALRDEMLSLLSSHREAAGRNDLGRNDLCLRFYNLVQRHNASNFSNVTILGPPRGCHLFYPSILTGQRQVSPTCLVPRLPPGNLHDLQAPPENRGGASGAVRSQAGAWEREWCTGGEKGVSHQNWRD